jgi:RNA-directed DNA polymerase
MGERNRETPATLRSGEKAAIKLLRIAEKAKVDKTVRFTSLYHLMNREHLRLCYEWLRKDAASGIDNQTKEDYGQDIEVNIDRLVESLHQMSYRPQPARRVYISKAGSDKMRPLGLHVVEDKLVQKGFVNILEAIYEADFIEDSYGFRPRRGCHDALRELGRTIEKRYVNFIVEADIKGFFDNVNHEWMMKFLKHRIADTKVLRMIKRFLIAGYVEDGKWIKGTKGTPQGGVISPLLANIYLHYALDLWYERVFRKGCQGYTRMIRYADDFLVCFQRKEEAERFMTELKERLAKFGLEIEPSKTRLVEFGRFAEANAEKKRRKPDTFDFLGFTHYCSKSRDGKRFRVKRKTSRKKFTVKLIEFKRWIKQSRTLPMSEIMKTVNSKLQGHFDYFGVTDNYKSIVAFSYYIRKILFKWLNRRSQKKSLNWDTFNLLIKRYPLPKPYTRVCLY